MVAQHCSMVKDIREYVKGCDVCPSKKGVRKAESGSMDTKDSVVMFEHILRHRGIVSLDSRAEGTAP